MIDPIVTHETSHSDKPFSEADGDYDTIITSVPKAWFVGDLMLAQIVAIETRKIAVNAAASMNRHLHHAQFVITNDPKTVKNHGLKHDCARCRANVDQVLALLREKPETKFCVGTLWYVP